VKRRAFLKLGLAVALCGPDAAARTLNEAEAETIAHAWSRELFVAPDRQALLPGLAADLEQLAAAGGQQRTIAQLSAYVAMIAASGGDDVAARRWWYRAQRAAAASGDSHLGAYVAGQRSVHVLYGGAPAHALRVADEALAVTNAPCAGRMHALSASAKAQALLGNTREALDALRATEATFERLPRDLTREKVSALGWAEERLHHTRSYAAAFGGIDGGDAAREAALTLYSPAAWRGPAQVKLHLAASERDTGYAAATLAALSDSQRHDRSVRLTAARVLRAAEQRGDARAAELREVVNQRVRRDSGGLLAWKRPRGPTR